MKEHRKMWAYIYNRKTHEGLEIGAWSDDDLERDLKDMGAEGIITDDCSVETYTVFWCD